MIHVKIKDPENNTTRKGWFIAPVTETYMLVVFKNDPEKRFCLINRERIHLDVFMPNKTVPVPPDNSLSEINKKLKERRPHDNGNP